MTPLYVWKKWNMVSCLAAQAGFVASFDIRGVAHTSAPLCWNRTTFPTNIANWCTCYLIMTSNHSLNSGGRHYLPPPPPLLLSVWTGLWKGVAPSCHLCLNACNRSVFARELSTDSRAYAISQWGRRSPLSPIRTSEWSSRLSGQRQIRFTQPRATPEHERHLVVMLIRLYFP